MEVNDKAIIELSSYSQGTKNITRSLVTGRFLYVSGAQVPYRNRIDLAVPIIPICSGCRDITTMSERSCM